MIHGAAGTLRSPGVRQLDDDLADARRVGVDRRGDVLVAERAIALAVLRIVQIDDRNLLARDVAPDVELGPAQQRMDAHVGALRQLALEVVPEFRRLVLEVPGAAFGARREHTLLAAGGPLVPGGRRGGAP